MQKMFREGEGALLERLYSLQDQHQLPVVQLVNAQYLGSI